MSEAKVYRDRVMAELDEGRNPLIELNSCRADVASDLIEQLVEMETSHNLSTYMDTLFGLFGVEQEHQSDASVVVRPGENMLMHEFPGLKEEGATITYQREKALTREDYDFLTWEHPMVSEAMEMLVSGELGNAALAKISVQGVKPGTLFLESIFVLNSMAPTHLQLDRFLPLTPRRFVVNLDGRDLSSVLPYDKLNELCSGIKRNLSHAILKEIRDDIKTLVGHAQSLAEKAMPGLLQAAEEQLAETMDKEIHRLRSLREKNPLIREEEIAFLENQKAQGLSYIEKTGLEMQALRVIIAT